MRRFSREILALFGVIVLVGLGILLAPFIGGILAERAHQADRVLLQDAIPLYQDTRVSPQPEWPTLSGEIGAPQEGEAAGYQCDGSDSDEICSWAAFELFVEYGALDSTDVITSAETTLNVGATNAPSGSYGWYINQDGRIASEPPFSTDVGYP